MADINQQFGSLVMASQLNLDTVLREQIGFIPAVWQNNTAAQAAIGQTIQYPLVPELELIDVAADCCDLPCPDPVDWQTASMVINYNKAVQFCWTGEEEQLMNNSFNGGGANALRGSQMDEAMRLIVNAVELSIADQAAFAGQIYNPVNGGVLFNQQSDNIKDLANIRKILHRTATPDNDRHLVMGFDASANLVNTYNLTRANENASDATLRRGEVLNMLNFGLHESAAADQADATRGTGTGYLANGAVAVGAKTVTVDTGTGTILPGDKIHFAADTANVYTVVSYAANVITLAQPIKVAVADNAAVTIDAAYGRQLAFHRRAIVLATRTPFLQGGGDRASNRAYITDPVSGLTMMLSQYGGYRANIYELALVWGVKMVKPEMAVLIPA